MDDVLVSICVPVFNSAANVERCLNAVLGQNLEQAEIIVLDNASEDETVAIATRMLQGVERARVVRQTSNVGRIGNWNRCLEVARGRFLKFALVNDVMLGGSLKVYLDAALRDRETVMVCAKARRIERVPEVVPEMTSKASGESLSSVETLQSLGRNGNRTAGLNGMLINLEPVRAHGLRFVEDSPFLADFLFAIHLACHGRATFLDAESHLFDSGTTARFHFAGFDRDLFIQEYRRCTFEIARLLRERGATDAGVIEGLWRAYLGMVYEHGALELGLAHRMFDGYPVHQARAVAHRTAYELKRNVPFLVPVGRRVRAALIPGR